MANLSEKIFEARKAKNLSVEDVAKATLLPMSIIRDLEAGKFDRYKGDEQYVKMYLKKLSSYLEINNDDIQNEYLEITQQYQLKDLQEAKEREEKYQSSGNTTIIQRIEDTIKNVEFKPIKRKEKRVYEDRYIVRYLKYAVLILLVLATIFVVWYAIILARSKDNSSFKSSHNSTVEVNDDSSSTTKKKTETSEETTTSAVTFTKNSHLNYNFKLNDNSETIKFKMEFVTQTWASLKVNGQDYSAFESTVYNENNTTNSLTAKPETVELEFKKSEFKTLRLRLGYNQAHRFYINGVQVPIEASDYSNNSDNLILTLVA